MIALIRAVSPRLGDCELTHVPRRPIDAMLAQAQHERYTATLHELGARIEHLPPLPESPDGVFVEDAAVVLDEVAVMARPGVRSRRRETGTVALALLKHRPTEGLSGNERLEGGDVMRIGRSLYVGQSSRTNAQGIARLRQVAQPLDYEVWPVEMNGCLHLKTGCTFIPPHFVVANPAWVDVGVFKNLTVIPVSDGEPFAANTLTVDHVTLVSTAFPHTEQALNAAGIATRRLDISELHKAEAGLTCLSILFSPHISPSQRFFRLSNSARMGCNRKRAGNAG